MSRWVVAGYLFAAACLTAGAGWYSIGAGLIVSGVCAGALTTLLVLDVGGD